MSEISGFADVIATMTKLDPPTDEAVLKAAAEICANIRGSAPQGETGDLAASWNVRPEGKNTAWVESREPYAARIEFGFHGTDSLGRQYDQAPEPYITPNLPQGQDHLLGAVLQALGKW